MISPDLCFVRRCLICGKELRTPLGPDVHEESAFTLRNHVNEHSEKELANYAREEALRGV